MPERVRQTESHHRLFGERSRVVDAGQVVGGDREIEPRRDLQAMAAGKLLLAPGDLPGLTIRRLVGRTHLRDLGAETLLSTCT
jgi:hypothetical protein